MNEKISQILNSLKILFSYAICMFIVLLYTLFVDGTSGVILLAFMVLVPLISVVFMLIAKNSVSIELRCPTNDYKKHNPIDLYLHLTKNTVIPIPFISITLGYSPHLCNSEVYSTKDFPQIKVSMAFEKTLEYSIEKILGNEDSFKAQVCGMGKVYIQDAYIYDYLGFFRVKLKNVFSNIDIYITPEIKDINSSQMLFNSICNSVIVNDEEEENNQDNTISVGSTLGFLHREYIQGDSPKRINWKLSCKKDKLMVRLDEPSPQSKPCILLDMSINNDTSNPLKSLHNFENLIESALSLANMCIKNGIECTFILCNCQQSIEYTLTSIGDICNLAVIISHNCANGEHRLPSSISQLKTSDSMYLLFTDVYEENLKSETNVLKSKGFLIDVILSPRYYGIYSNTNVWVVNKDLSIVQSGY